MSATITLGCVAISKEEDQLLDSGDITPVLPVALPPPEQVLELEVTPNERDDITLTSKDVGDNMGDI